MKTVDMKYFDCWDSVPAELGLVGLFWTLILQSLTRDLVGLVGPDLRSDPSAAPQDEVN